MNCKQKIGNNIIEEEIKGNISLSISWITTSFVWIFTLIFATEGLIACIYQTELGGQRITTSSDFVW